MSLNLITIAATGERKSAADHEALWPVRKHEAALRERRDVDLPQYANDLAAWKKQREQILADKKRFASREAKRRALDEMGPSPQAPLEPLLLISQQYT